MHNLLLPFHTLLKLGKPFRWAKTSLYLRSDMTDLRHNSWSGMSLGGWKRSQNYRMVRLCGLLTQDCQDCDWLSRLPDLECVHYQTQTVWTTDPECEHYLTDCVHYQTQTVWTTDQECVHYLTQTVWTTDPECEHYLTQTVCTIRHKLCELQTKNVCTTWPRLCKPGLDYHIQVVWTTLCSLCGLPDLTVWNS